MEEKYNFKTSKEDMLLAVRKLSFGEPDALPLSFTYGEREIRGIPADFNPKKTEKLVDSRITEKVITGSDGTGLRIRAEIYEYRDFPVCEYTVYFTNCGSEPSDVIGGLSALDADFCGNSPVLVHGNGDDCTENGYKFFEDKIGGEPIEITPKDDGTSCAGAYPFMRVRFKESVLTLAVGWSGSWKALFSANELGINIKAGQKYTNFRVLPGETLRTPRILLMTTAGSSELRSMNIWRRFYNEHIMPKQWGENIAPKACMHVFNYKSPEFTGATEDSQLFGLAKYIEKGVKPDLWWYDAGFYKCDGNWPAVGTWEEDRARWPNNGLAPLGEECAKNGIDLMVWFEPERVTEGSEIEREHPEFLLRLKKDDGSYEYNSLFNLGNKEALKWLLARIDGLIKKWHISVYRQDFNFPPFEYWRSNEAPDRLGALENLSIQGYYEYWDSLLFKNPGLFIDSCASGGRRNDLETLRRAVPFQYTDVGLGDHAQKQKQHLMLFEWAPYFRAHTMAWDNFDIVDEFAWFNAFAPAVTFTTPVWGKEEEFALARKMLPIWRKCASLELTGDYYPQMKKDYDNGFADFFCTSFFDPLRGEGFVLYIRNRDCEGEQFTAKLPLEADTLYEMTNPVSGESFIKTGKELECFTQKLEKRSGAVWCFKKI